VKTYPSFRDFEAELTHQLMYRPEGSRIDSGRDVLTDYQRFFSRFLSEKDRPHFFLRLTQKVLDSPAGSNWKDDLRGYLKYLSPVSNLKGPIEDRHWRRDPRENVELHISLSLNFQWVGLSGIWYEMFVSDPVSYLFKNADPKGSLRANVSNAAVRCLSNMKLADMLETRHSMSQAVRGEVRAGRRRGWAGHRRGRGRRWSGG
jgi:hypothetical protein